MAEQLTGRSIRVITNSLAVFNILVNHAPTEVILTGGDYRDNTNTFVGPITNLVLGKLKYNKAFISCNGIYNSSITTYSLEEGESQQIALDNSKNKYLLADNKKFNRADFYIYYDLFNFDTLITDNTIDDEVLSHYKQICTNYDSLKRKSKYRLLLISLNIYDNTPSIVPHLQSMSVAIPRIQ